MRTYLQKEIETKFNDSELAKLIKDLDEIEAQLDAMDVKYDAIELPERFKSILNRLNEEERFNVYIELLDALPNLPFIPIKQMYIALLRIAFSHRHQLRQILLKKS